VIEGAALVVVSRRRRLHRRLRRRSRSLRPRHAFGLRLDMAHPALVLHGHSRSATPNPSTSFLRASSHLSSTACRLARGSAARHSHRQRIRSAPTARRQLARPVCLADRLALYPHIGTCTRCLERLSQALRNPLYPVVVSRPRARPPRPRLRSLCPGHILNALPALLPRPHRGLPRSRSPRPQTPTPRLNLHALPN